MSGMNDKKAEAVYQLAGYGSRYRSGISTVSKDLDGSIELDKDDVGLVEAVRVAIDVIEGALDEYG